MPVEQLGYPLQFFPEDVVLTERDGSWWDSAGLEWAEMDSVTWFGSMGYSNFSTPEDEKEEGRECPVCHQNVPLAQWYELIFCGEKPPDPGWSGVLESGKWQVRIVDRTTPWSWEGHCVQV